MCGGTRRQSIRRAGGQGLSPRVRGNQRRRPRGAYPGRSIPACAGEPGAGRWAIRRATVYPRVCGGTSVSWRSSPAVVGLSPRVRGNLRLLALLPGGGRSIPACAGEPVGVTGFRGTPGVYPRVCGGTVGIADVPAVFLGLSPRVRGNLPGGGRSIPACAGEPYGASSDLRVRRVYPRVCGGTARPGSATRWRRGLSPRVRGNLRPVISSARPEGSIPACAGEPRGIRRRRPPRRVYPRVCGGTAAVRSARRRRPGLSPRVRGNQFCPPRRRMMSGSIPACAGEPAGRTDNPAGRTVYPRVCGGTRGRRRNR